jgi:hypothetical protein
MRRIAVNGCGGAGKTTLANELGRRLCLPVLHVDGFYWQERPGSAPAESTPEQWRRIHEEMISGERFRTNRSAPHPPAPRDVLMRRGGPAQPRPGPHLPAGRIAEGGEGVGGSWSAVRVDA